jgi:outer membrane protein OmpA-like peptidoglycan-associated protein
MERGDDRQRARILARRARFVAAALAGLGPFGELACGPHGEPSTAGVTKAAPPSTTSEPTDGGSTSAKAATPGDADGDGIPDENDVCPNEPEDHDGLDDEDGCPELDKDKDGIPDQLDGCPDTAGPPNATPNKNGCPMPCLTIVTPVRFFEVVEFSHGSAILAKEVLPVIHEIAQVLKVHPEFTLSIEGHCDDTEPDALGEKRAMAVRARLAAEGIDIARLTPHGLGKANPKDTNSTAAGRAHNRRVEFVRTDP